MVFSSASGGAGGIDLVGHRVDGDDARALLGRAGADELADALGGLGGGQDGRRGAVVEHGVQPADVTGLAGVEQRHRDPAGVQGAEQRDQVVQVLRAQHRDAVAGLGDLLQPGAHRAVAGAELRPGDVAGDAVALGGEVQESVGELVATNPRPFLNVLDQVRVLGELDLSIHDERVVVRHSALLSHLCSVGQADVVVRSARADGYMSTQCPRTVHARAAPQPQPASTPTGPATKSGSS